MRNHRLCAHSACSRITKTGASLEPHGQYIIRQVPDGVAFPSVQGYHFWKNKDLLQLTAFPWYVRGIRQRTTARLAFNRSHLFLEFVCEDRHSTSGVTELNGPVWKDSCVEFFAAPDGNRPGYFNLEINACGYFLLGYGPSRETRALIPPEYAKDIDIHSSLPGPVKEASGDDAEWRIVAAVPFSTLSNLCGMEIQPVPGARWNGNLYRCGGRIDPQYACWTHVSSATPDFHRAEQFGRLFFA